MMRVLIVHTHEQVVQALEVATERDASITLQSAPDAVFYAGALYLLHMFNNALADFPRARAHFILDCSDAGAEAIAAMQIGHTHIRSSAAPGLRAKLADIARARQVTFIDGPYEALDLRGQHDEKGACRRFLSL